MDLPLRTDRLVIDVMRAPHAEAFAAYRNLPDVARHQSWALPFGVDDARDSLREQSSQVGLGRGRWTQLALTDGRGLRGDIAVRLSSDGTTAEVGVTLDPAAQGIGLASEALTAVIDALLADGVEFVSAHTDPANARVVRLLERLGFECSGRVNRSLLVRGAWVDDLVWEIDPARWRAWTSRPTGRPAVAELVVITPDTARTFSRLRVHHSQQHLVAPVLDSYGDALFPEYFDGGTVAPWLRGVLADGEPAGFVMTAEVTEVHTEPYLWRLLIDRRHQGRGLGTFVVRSLVERYRADGHSSLTVGWITGLNSPEPFYRGLGFEPTGKVDHGEVEGRLRW